MWTPTHIIVTVSKAKGLLDKGKGGNDAYCMIGMGKEKFLTSVRNKTLSPIWDEQAEFELNERADLKLTVYHKSSIIDEFIGRVVINVSELFNENNKAFTKWYKLQSKEENSKKAAKERGEIEVRVEFITKAKTGSVMDLSTFSKNKEKTLSLRNLKDKSSNLKQSIGDKFNILKKPRKSKFNGENQLAEQSRRMDGSKLDFLDGEDIGSLTSSYSSINGSRLTNDNINNNKQMNSMSRYNPSRSSFVSGASSRLDMDSSSINDNSTHNEDDFNEENEENYTNNNSTNHNNNNNTEQDFTQSFNRNNSFRRSSIKRHSKLSISNPLQAKNQNRNNDDLSSNHITYNNHSESLSQSDPNKIHIAPLPPFLGQSSSNNSNSEQSLTMQQRYDVLNSIIHEENPANMNTSTYNNNNSNSNNNNNNLNVNNYEFNDSLSPKTNNENESSFASIFSSSFATTGNTNDKNDFNFGLTKNEQFNKNSHQLSAPVSPPLSDIIIQEPVIDTTNVNSNKKKKSIIELSPKSKETSSSFNSSVVTLTKSEASKTSKTNRNSNLNYNDEEDDDHIDWASSDDEEIVKEVETFERNQVLNNQSNNQSIDLFNNNKNKNEHQNHSDNINSNNNNSNNNSFQLTFTPFNSDNLNQTNNLIENDLIKTSGKFVKNNQTLEVPDNFPLSSSFSIDIDPFSSSSSSTNSSRKSSTFNLNKLEQINFENDFFSTITNSNSNNQPTAKFNINPFNDPFLDFDFKMEDSSNKVKQPEEQVNDEPFKFDSNFSDFKLENETDINNSTDDDNNNRKSLNEDQNGEDINDLVDRIEEENENVNEEEVKENNLKDNGEDGDSDSSNSYTIPPPIPKSQRLSIVSTKLKIEDPFLSVDSKTEPIKEDDINLDNNENVQKSNDDETNNNDLDDDLDMDNAFTKFSANLELKTDDASNNEFSNLANELNEASRAFADIDESANTNNNDTNIDLAMRKGGDMNLKTVHLNNEYNDDYETNQSDNRLLKSQLVSDNETDTDAPPLPPATTLQINPFNANRILRQSERRKLIPTQDLTSDLNSERDFSTGSIHNTSFGSPSKANKQRNDNDINHFNHSNRSSMRINLMDNNNNNNRDNSKLKDFGLDDDIKTPEFDQNYMFQDDQNGKSDIDSTQNTKSHGLPDLIYQKEPTDKAKKYLEGLDGVKLTEIDVPDSLKKQLEYFDRDELLQLIAYQKKYLDFKESRIKDLENYIDNLVVKIIETEPLILMNASNVLAKSKNMI